MFLHSDPKKPDEDMSRKTASIDFVRHLTVFSIPDCHGSGKKRVDDGFL
jgi:hypothetical protein